MPLSASPLTTELDPMMFNSKDAVIRPQNTQPLDEQLIAHCLPPVGLAPQAILAVIKRAIGVA